MPHFGNFYSVVGWMLLRPLATPAFAHTDKVSGDVATAFYIESHHNPKAGEPAQTWFALTQKGGVITPLAQCDCKLSGHQTVEKQMLPDQGNLRCWRSPETQELGQG